MANKNKGATLIDIARRTGVSVATVSRYLNNNLEVKETTSQRIEQAIKDLHYVPNLAARALRTQVSKSVGIIIPNIQNPLFAAIMAGIEEILRSYGYGMLVLLNKNDRCLEEQCVNSLLERSVDGVIFIGYPKEVSREIKDDYVQKLIQAGIKVVFINRIFDEPDISSVNSDFPRGAKEAMYHLVASGRRRVAAIVGSLYHPESLEKLRGYREVMAEYNLDFEPGLIGEGFYEYGWAYQVTQKLLQFHPDAFVVANDLMAVACMKAIKDQGLHIPDDVAVIGYGDTVLCEVASPALSSINQEAFNLGYKGGEVLLGEITHQRQSHTHLVLPTRFIKRASS